MNWKIILLATIGGSINSIAQTTSFEPSLIRVGLNEVRVGCDSVTGQAYHDISLDAAMNTLLNSFRSRGVDKKERRRIEREQKHWLKARDRYCSGFSLEHDGNCHVCQECVAWASQCRLDVLLNELERLAPEIHWRDGY